MPNHTYEYQEYLLLASHRTDLHRISHTLVLS